MRLLSGWTSCAKKFAKNICRHFSQEQHVTDRVVYLSSACAENPQKIVLQIGFKETVSRDLRLFVFCLQSIPREATY
jgi:hypothetical protein